MISIDLASFLRMFAKNLSLFKGGIFRPLTDNTGYFNLESIFGMEILLPKIKKLLGKFSNVNLAMDQIFHYKSIF